MNSGSPILHTILSITAWLMMLELFSFLWDLDSHIFDTSKVWNRSHDSHNIEVTDHFGRIKIKSRQPALYHSLYWVILICGIVLSQSIFIPSISKLPEIQDYWPSLNGWIFSLMDSKSQVILSKTSGKMIEKVHFGKVVFQCAKGSKFQSSLHREKSPSWALVLVYMQEKTSLKYFAKREKVSVLSYIRTMKVKYWHQMTSYIFRGKNICTITRKRWCISRMDGWNFIIFLNQPLSTVFSQLERQFDVKIAADENIKQWPTPVSSKEIIRKHWRLWLGL